MKQVLLDEQDIKRIFKTDTGFGKFLKFSSRMLRQALYLAVLFFIFFLAINYGAFWKRLNYTVTAAPKADTGITPAPPAIVEPAKPDYPPEIQIAKINVTAPIILNIKPEDTVQKLVDGVVHMEKTALPGEIGNTVITGHSSDFPWSTGHYKNVFALLDKLVIGDQIVIPYKSEKYVYAVTETKTVKPTDVSILARTDEPTLTLITCYPVGTTQKRLIIRARLISGATTGTQAEQPNLPTNLLKAR